MSGIMSGRLVQPCAECGAKLRMSSMAAVSSVAALGLIGTAVVYVWADPEWRSYLLFVALGLLLVILIAMLATRIESVPPAPAAIEPPPERIGKKRM
jgi:predicted membrane channel-forming protein YqfA (hemolysin III family)